MKIHKFNANVNKVKRHLKQDSGKQIRKLTTSLCVFIIIVGIVYFSYAKFEEGNVFNITNATVGEFFDGTYSEYLAQCDDGIAECIKSAPHKQRENVISDNTVDNNLRYIGANPNNYIKFNNELWRIIGVMNNVEDESGNRASRVKLIRSSSLGVYIYDTSTASINSGYGINQWGESGTYEGADLMRELNTDYLGNITVGTDSKWYNNSNNQKTGSMPTSLNQTAVNMIESVKWNLGSTNNFEDNDLNSINFYQSERSNNVVCNGNCSDNVVRTTSWTGKVGLFYASDYGFATSGGNTTSRDNCLSVGLYNMDDSNISDCNNNNWFYNTFKERYSFTLTPRYSGQNSNFAIYSGKMYTALSAYNGEVLPTLYLKQNINIIAGTGTSSDPYRLSVEGFSYTGGEQTYTVPKDGTYKLETWGAQGGDATWTGNVLYRGGYGSYSIGNASLNSNTTLYINVGQTGVDNCKGSCNGGYNGGGIALGRTDSSEPKYEVSSGSGGGATHIATISGELKNLSSYKDSANTYDSNGYYTSNEILIVSGGGGGSLIHRYNDDVDFWHGYGGDAGGYQSVSGLIPNQGRSNNPGQATQTHSGVGYNVTNSIGSGSFGQGQNGNVDPNNGEAAGAGGGFFGGGSSIYTSTSGGSGYIGSSNLISSNGITKHMTCYNCDTSNDDRTKTNSNTCYSLTPQEDCAKEGNGYAQITYIGN